MLNEKNAKVRFRPIAKYDLELLRKWRMHPEVTKYLYTDPILTKEDQEKWYANLQEINDIYWIISYDKIDIGYAALRDVVSNISADPGIFIADTRYRKKGIAKFVIGKIQEYAFEVMGLSKLYGPVLSENYGALMAYLKNGWIIEGCLKRHIYKNKKYYDVYMIALFREDWRLNRRTFSRLFPIICKGERQCQKKII